MQIGGVAARTGVTVEALRYYEKWGLVRPIARRGSGYREYGADSVRVVLFIKRAQALGFLLTEVEDLVRLRERAWVGDAPRLLRDAAVANVEDIDHAFGSSLHCEMHSRSSFPRVMLHARSSHRSQTAITNQHASWQSVSSHVR